MISTEKVQLGNRDFIYSEGKDWKYLLFGVTFLFFGVLMVNKCFSSEEEFPLLMFGLVFMLIGLYTFTFWVIGLIKKSGFILPKSDLHN